MHGATIKIENSIVSVQNRALYTKTYVRVIVAGDINLP